MDFSDESYVRLFVRDTKTWLRLEFEGQCVLMFLLRKLDRAGVLDGIDDPENDVALITKVPLKIVRVGLARLLKLEVFELRGTCLVMPNYIDAQNAVRTDKARQRDAREKRRSKARHVTPRDEMSREQTDGHEPSQPVTLYCAVPDSTVLDPDPERAREEWTKPPEPEGIPSRPETLCSSYPPGWRWSPETEAAAALENVSPPQLQEHVNYWTIHVFCPVRERDLDAELRRSIPGIVKRAQGARMAASSGAAGGGLWNWVPNAEHRAFAAKKGRDLSEVVPAYRREFRPEKHSTVHADSDFMRRLVCWDATGAFIAVGELPKPPQKIRLLRVENDRTAVAS